MEELGIKHRKEIRDLQSRITQKKKNATKKSRKGVNDECDRLERDLQERQRSEIDSLAGVQKLDGTEEQAITDQEEPETTSDLLAGEQKRVKFDSAAGTGESIDSNQHNLRKPNRQKARLARRAAEQEAQISAAEKEAADLPDLRQQEITSMKAQMINLGLREIVVRPDGHCLYSACALGISAEQIAKVGPHAEGYRNVRFVAADYMSKHSDDFSAFLDEPLDNYVHKVRDTAEWGGQLELQAIARSLKMNINVLQADGRTERIMPVEGVEPEQEIWLAYYRHSFGLGEHYNALKKENTG